MCKMTPLFHWLMEYLLREECDNSKNRMADMLGIDRQTLRRAFRRTEQENTGVTPMVAEKIMLYFFEHKQELDNAINEYGRQAVALSACPQFRKTAEKLTDRLEGSTSVPQYAETVHIIEALQLTLGCHRVELSGSDHTRGYCYLHADCPLNQLIALYNHYLAERDVELVNAGGVKQLDTHESM